MAECGNQGSVSRRTVLTAGALLGVGTLLSARDGARADEPSAEAPPRSPADALARLRSGNEHFAAGTPLAPQRDLAHLRAIAPQQRPFAAVLACADSRVPVEILYDQGFGDLFVVRVAGNVATAVEIASLEYAAHVLGVSAIVVLGHSNCGAVQAALRGGPVPGQISTLYQHIAPALNRKTMDLDAAITANVHYQARKLRKGSTVLGPLVSAGKVALAGGVFELTSGTVRAVEL
jgi:carbonic anhydrase